MRVPDTTQLSDVLEDIHQNAECSEVKCSKKDSGPWMNADISSDVGLLANDFGCRYIRFVQRKEPECDELPPAKRACSSMTIDTVLMAGRADRDCLPKSKVVINRKDQLFNDVCGLLAEKKGRLH